MAVFGVSLETAVQRSQLGTDGVELPTVFREFIDFLEEHGESDCLSILSHSSGHPYLNSLYLTNLVIFNIVNHIVCDVCHN